MPYSQLLAEGRIHAEPTSGESGQAAVIEFLRIWLDGSFAPLLDTMDRIQRLLSPQRDQRSR